MDKQKEATIRLAQVVLEAIKDGGAASALGGVPSGHLYAVLSATGMTLERYQEIIDLLKRCDLVREENHLLSCVST